MSNYSKNGNVWVPHRDGALNLQPSLDPGNYTLKLNPMTSQFYLEKISDFELPDSLFGDISSLAERVVGTFLDRPGCTGVLLAGEKGSGKTLLAKKVCVDLGLPVIVINKEFCGDDFNSFIQSISDPAVIFFDEFEKTYDAKSQEKLLTLLDGVYSSKKLFLLTSNVTHRVDEHMRNRPGRIYYFFEFKGLGTDFVREYCTIRLVNKEHVERVCGLAKLFENFNFDMLKAVVEELNRYPTLDPREAVKLLNVKPDAERAGVYKASLAIGGVNAEIERGDTTMIGNPLSRERFVFNFKKRTGEGEDDWNWEDVSFGSEDFINFDAVAMTYTFKQGDFVATLVRVPGAARGTSLPF